MKLYRLLLSFYPARFREEYGGPLEQQFADEYREARGARDRARLWLQTLRDLAWSIPIELAHEMKQDLVHSLRVHARRPFLMLFTVAILALAIGGATGVFSVVNAVLIKALPFRDAGQLAMLPGRFIQNPEEFHRWRTHTAYLADAASFGTAAVNVAGASAPMRVTLAETSFNFFALLGTDTILGRSFAPTEDLPGSDGVAVISYSLWQQMYGGDPRVLGQKLLVSGAPLEIIGVARPGFDFPGKTSVWAPTIFDFGKIPVTGVFFWQAIGRIKSGLTMQQAEPMFEAELERTNHGRSSGPSEQRPRLTPLRTELAGKIREASLVLLGAIGFVLLIACANVANVLLTRTTERWPELMIRSALGASRARLMQQLLSESVLLSTLAAAAGLGVAQAVAKFAALAQPAELASQQYTLLDWRVALFACAIACATGLLFGVAPAWLVRRLQPSGDLARMHTTGSGSRLRGVLIAVQVSLTLVLLTGAVTMGRGLLGLLGTDIGFTTDHLVTVSVSLAGTAADSDQRRNAYGSEALERLRQTTGVESAAAIDFLPLATTSFAGGSLFPETGGKTSIVVYGKVTADFFRTMGARLVYGREFTASDSGAAIVTEGIARQIAPGASVIGRRVHLGQSKEWHTIVGVVREIRYRGPEGPGIDQILFPTDRDFPMFATFIARMQGNASDALAICRDAVQSVDREIPVFGVKTYRQRLDETLATPRFRTTVFLFFGGFALLLAIAGIYGVSSYSVAMRRREIGVRIAIGATPRRVRGMMLRQALAPIAVGIAAGIGGAAWQGSLLRHLLSAAPPLDVATCAACAAVLALSAAAAIWSATGRVATLNPIDALKSE
jgi:putative ABC transport system permease protein